MAAQPNSFSISDLWLVVARPRTYSNLVYLMLAFPLGIFYFVYLVTGLSLGFGLIITLAGIPILLAVLGGSWVFCVFERELARVLLGTNIEFHANAPTAPGWWGRMKAFLTDQVTWTGVGYLLLRFPLGIASFVAVVTLLAVSLGLIAAPTYYWVGDSANVNFEIGSWDLDTFGEALLLTIVGFPLLPASLHLLNGWAWVSGRVASLMLGTPRRF